MNEESKLSLYIAIGLPIFFLIGLIGVVAVPKFFAEEPQYDFVYKTRNSNYNGPGYGSVSYTHLTLPTTPYV